MCFDGESAWSKLSLAASTVVRWYDARAPHGLPFGNHPMEEEDCEVDLCTTNQVLTKLRCLQNEQTAKVKVLDNELKGHDIHPLSQR